MFVYLEKKQYFCININKSQNKRDGKTSNNPY